MHGLSLIRGLLAKVSESAAAEGITRVERIRLVVGEAHHIKPDEPSFAFSLLAPGTVLAGAELEIGTVPEKLACQRCGKEYYPGQVEQLTCPACRARLSFKQGQELYVDYYEGEKPEQELG